MTRPSQAGILAATAALLGTLVAGCAGPMDRAGTLGPWEFTAPGTSLPPAVLRHTGAGRAVGPDLKVHDAQLYSLAQPIQMGPDVLWIDYTIALTEDFHVLSIHSPCNGFDVKDGGTVCADLAQVTLPVGEESLFFNAPLVLDSIPASGGPFSVEVWSAGRLVQASFVAEERGGDLLVRRAGPRVVEHFVLDDPRESNGRVLDCDVFEGGELVLRGRALGCRDKGQGEWWVEGPIPRVGGRWKPGDLQAPVAVQDVEHHVPAGTTGLSFPIEDAIAAVRAKDSHAKESMDSGDWLLGELTYTQKGGSTIAPGSPVELACVDYEWDLSFVVRNGTDARSVATRSRCGQLDFDEAVPAVAAADMPWPDSRRATRIDQASEVMGSVLCLPDEDPSVWLKSRGLSGANETWLILGGVPQGSSAGGGSLNGMVFHHDSGYLLTVNENNGAGHLLDWMLSGRSDCPEAGAPASRQATGLGWGRARW